jgi:hypothetical protein
VSFITPQLEAFATAIIENYKAGLVLVAWRHKVTGEFCTGGFELKAVDQWVPLYALGETK